ncbi:TPA: DUF4059 family protein [Streptococcus suis]|nr:DUF4059 family protein [Streptococcus suis]
MLQNILSFYLQGLLVAAVLDIVISLIYFVFRAGRKVDRTPQERQDFIFDLLMINVMIIPVLAFGVMGILLMFKA